MRNNPAFLKRLLGRAFLLNGIVNAILMVLLMAGWPASLTIDDNHSAMEAVHFVALVQLIVLFDSALFAAIEMNGHNHTSVNVTAR